MTQDLVPNLDAAFDLLMDGVPLKKIVADYGLDEREFERYCKRRFKTLLTVDQLRHRAKQLGKLDRYFRLWSPYAVDPKYGNLILKAMQMEDSYIMPTGKGIDRDKLGDVIDLERVKRVVKESKERTNAAKAVRGPESEPDPGPDPED